MAARESTLIPYLMSWQKHEVLPPLSSASGHQLKLFSKILSSQSKRSSCAFSVMRVIPDAGVIVALIEGPFNYLYYFGGS